MVSPRVSVIVPFYNSEATLAACLESLRGQTLKDIEIILVDDGSTDNGFAVARNFAEGYEGICTVLHQENKGPSAARNRGLDLAVGEFVAFVDSDDSVAPTMYEKMVDSADKYGSDIVSCGRRSVDSLTGEVVKEKVPKYDVLKGSVRTNPSIAKRVSPLMCDKMFRRSIIVEHDLRLDEDIRHAEDYLFSSRYRLHTSSVSAVGEALYQYKVGNKNSLSGGNAHALDIPLACRRVAELYRREGVLNQTKKNLLYVFSGYYLRKCDALPLTSLRLKMFKRSFRGVFSAYFGAVWMLVAIKRILREHKGVDCFFLLVKAFI